MLALAKAKAEVKKLDNIDFRVADMLDLGSPDASFDAVVCAFGIFFVPDMTAAIKELWRMVKPGGRLAITTWGPDLFEPANSAFWHVIGNVRPDLQRSFIHERISKPSGLRELFAEANIDIQTDYILAESGTHALNSPDDWWAIAMGSGYRGTLAQLDAETVERVRIANLSCLHREQVKSINTNVVYAVATKR